jgi:fatty acid desaturase
MHDAVHYRLFSHRFANQWVSDLLCAFPIGLSTALYRRSHLPHHRHTSTDKDPDWTDMQASENWHWPKTRIVAAKIFLFDLLGLNFFEWTKIIKKWSPVAELLSINADLPVMSRAEKIVFVLSSTFVLSLLFYLGVFEWFVLYWILPIFTSLSLMVRIRSVSEHLNLPAENELNESRHVDGSLFERLTVAPLNINVHIAHHMFPSVPHYNLPTLHERLLKEEIYAQNARIVKRYFGGENSAFSELFQR